LGYVSSGVEAPNGGDSGIVIASVDSCFGYISSEVEAVCEDFRIKVSCGGDSEMGEPYDR